MKSIINNIKINFNEYHFILLWLLINIIQIGTTELTSDEGYYWFYSTRLEWGYYDHPPLLSLLIKLGGLIFPGEAGVRFFNVLLMTLGLILLFRLEDWSKREKNFLYLIILSIPLFNYITIIAFPDTPLVAFSILCLYSYKQLLKKNDLISSLLFGFSIALMLYSKLTAVLFVLFILLSNLNLLKNRLFYLSIVLAIFLFLPHLLWQYQHDFPSFRYHLVDRASSFDSNDLFQYITQQIPVIGIGIIFIPFTYKTENQFYKTLKFISIGTLIFFLLYTLRGFVHLHWTSIMLFPVIILSVKYYSRKRNNKLFNCLVLPFLIIILVARFYLSFRFIPVNTLHVDYYHGRKMWAEDIKAISGNRPVIFETGYGSLREASLYSFYSKSMGVALYPDEDKKSQYQLWNYEDSVQSKSVILVRNSQFEESRELHTRMGKSIYYKEIDEFISFNNIKIIIDWEKILQKGDTLIIPANIINHRQDPINFNTGHTLFLNVQNKGNEEAFFEQSLDGISIKAGDSAYVYFNINIDGLDNSYLEIVCGISDGVTDNPINSERKKYLLQGNFNNL